MHPLTNLLKYIGMVLALGLSAKGLAQNSDPDTIREATPTTSAAAHSGSSAGAATKTDLYKTSDEIARELSNPLAVFTSLAYRIEYQTYQGSVPGAGDQTSWVNVFQPVIPFMQKNGKGFVFRFALPIKFDQPIYDSDRSYPEWRMRQEDPTLNGEGYWDPTHGHTDAVSFDLVYGGVNETGFIFMYGLAGILPTSSDTSNARQQLILGPALNIGKIAHWGTYGALISHIIDITEKTGKNTPDTTMTNVQLYFTYALGNGWQLVSNPTISYDWEGDSGNKLAIPLGGGIAKTTKFGKMPLKIDAQLQNYVASTDRFSPDWLFKLTFTPVYPNKYTRN